MASNPVTRADDTSGDSFQVFNDGSTSARSQGFTMCDDSGLYMPAPNEQQVESALGNITGYEYGHKFGHVRDMDTVDSNYDIWSMADDARTDRVSTKTFLTSSASLYVVSDSASDSGMTCTVEYIDASGDDQSTDVTMNGQTPVLVGTALDINSMHFNGSTANVGEIYGMTGNTVTAGVPDTISDVLCHIPATYGQSQMAMFTVPLGVNMVVRGLALTMQRTSGAAGSAEVHLLVKEYGGFDHVETIYFLSNSYKATTGIEFDVFPARSQVKWRVVSVSDNDTSISAKMRYELIATS